MFIRQKKNKSGSKSVQIISKAYKKYKVIKTLGSSKDEKILKELVNKAKQEIENLQQQYQLYLNSTEETIFKLISDLKNSNIRIVGPELIFGRIYDKIGFSAINEPLFRHLVIARVAYPLSKLKTVSYLSRYQGITIDIDSIYRFMDKLNDKLKPQIEQISFEHTNRILKGNLSVVFYDMTTLYFEASDEDDLRMSGFSKDGKHSNPQIYLGLLVGLGGYAIGYQIYEGKLSEGHTLIPFIEGIRKKFNLDKPILVADSGLLSSKNTQALREMGYKYILGGRIKNERAEIKQKILSHKPSTEKPIVIEKNANEKLIVSYSPARAKKDMYNRQKGLKRLEKQIKSGKLTKSNINNRGYNKYLKMNGKVNIEIDYGKYEADSCWDGLKGYITNTELEPNLVIEHYNNLWYIEKAFRMSKTDLRIRPIYHRVRRRIEAHICISFTAYCIYKELERVLNEEKLDISIVNAVELTYNMFELTYTVPETNRLIKKLLQMDEKQAELYKIVEKHF